MPVGTMQVSSVEIVRNAMPERSFSDPVMATEAVNTGEITITPRKDYTDKLKTIGAFVGGVVLTLAIVSLVLVFGG